MLRINDCWETILKWCVHITPTKSQAISENKAGKKLRAEDKEECSEILSSKNDGACAIINSLL